MATKASGRKGSPRPATNPIIKLLESKFPHGPVFDKAEITAVQDFHRKQIEQHVRTQFERDTNEIIKPRLDQLEAARKVKPDSPLGVLLRQLAERVPVRTPTRPEFHPPPLAERTPVRAPARPEFLRIRRPATWAQHLRQQGNYSLGDPDPAVVVRPPPSLTTPATTIAGAWADRINGRLYVGVADSDIFPPQGAWGYGDSNVINASLRQWFSLPQSVGPGTFVRAEADVHVWGDPPAYDNESSYPVVLFPGTREVGVWGYVTITIYGAGTNLPPGTKTFLQALDSPTPQLNGPIIYPNSVTLATEGWTTSNVWAFAVAVDATLIAFRGGNNDPRAGTAAASFQWGMNMNEIVGPGLPVGEPLAVQEMRLSTYFNQNWL